MYTLLYFSPTGNVLHLTEVLADHLGPNDATVVPLEFTDPEQLAKNEHLVLLYPLHGFNPPRNVTQFVRRLPTGLFATVSLISIGCTDHWVNHAASSGLRGVLETKGYSIGLDEIFAMPLTFVMEFPKELARKLVVESESRIENLDLTLETGTNARPRISGKSRVLGFLGKLESPASRLFGLELHADKKCNSCGTCWTRCPQRNITRGRNDRPRFGFNCLMCLRCVYDCPTHAIRPRFSRFIPIKNGYSLSRYLKEGAEQHASQGPTTLH